MCDTRENIAEVFAAILQLPTNEIQDDVTPEAFERWDSFQHLFLIAGFEEEFGIEIEPEEVVDMYKNFRAFREVVEKKIADSLRQT